MSKTLSEDKLVDIMADRLRESTLIDTEEVPRQRLIEQSRWLTESILDYLDTQSINAVRAANPLDGLVKYMAHYDVYTFVLKGKIRRQEAIISPDTLISRKIIDGTGPRNSHVHEFELHTQEFPITTYLSIMGEEKANELEKQLLAIRERIRKDEIAEDRRNDPSDY